MWRLLNWIIDTLIIISPLYWIMNHGYNHDWNKKLNELLDSNNVDFLFSSYRVDIGDSDVWIGNYPYSYGTTKVMGREVRPSRRTILRLKKVVDLAMLSEAERRELKLKKLGI
jgi:hypothetical protein